MPPKSEASVGEEAAPGNILEKGWGGGARAAFPWVLWAQTLLSARARVIHCLEVRFLRVVSHTCAYTQVRVRVRTWVNGMLGEAHCEAGCWIFRPPGWHGGL